MTISKKKFTEKYCESTLTYSEIDDADKKRLSDVLAAVYMMDGDEAASCLELCEDECIRSLDSIEEYNLAKRLIQFYNETGGEKVISAPLLDVLDLKGKAIFALHDAGVRNFERNELSGDVLNGLATAARNGNTTAMYLYALFNMEGIAVPEDRTLGMELLDKLSRWPDADGLLLSLHYMPARRRELMSALYTVLRGRSEASLYAAAKLRYGIANDVESSNMQLLSDAINRGAGKPDVYESKLTRVAYSKVISQGYKREVLYSCDAAFINAVSALPLKLATSPSALPHCAIETVLGRTAEQQKLARVLASKAVISPDKVMITSGDMYVLDVYMKAIKNAAHGFSAHIIKLNDLDRSRLEATQSNVLLRTLGEDKPELVLIEIGPKCPRENIELLADMLDDNKRAHFSLPELRGQLDLTGVTFVVFCHDSEKRSLAGLVEIPLAKVSAEEREAALSEQIRDVEQQWSVRFTDDGVAKKLDGVSLSDSQQMLDYIAKTSYFNGETDITAAVFDAYMSSLRGSHNLFGFGRE